MNKLVVSLLIGISFLISIVFALQIGFVPPSPTQNQNVTGTNADLNVTINDTGDSYAFFTDGLLAWYRLDNSSIVAENDTNIYDWSGYQNNGTATTTAIVNTTGKFSQSFTFRGTTNSTINIPNQALTGNFTVSFWYWNSNNSGTQVIVGEDSGNTGSTPKIGKNANNFFLRLVTTSDNTVVMPSINNWHLVTITRDPTNKVDLYLDGNSTNNRLFANAAQSGTYTFDKIGSNGDGSQAFNGSIDEVIVFNRTLNASEIPALYNSSVYTLMRSLTGLDGIQNFTANSVNLSGSLVIDSRSFLANYVAPSNCVAPSSGNWLINGTFCNVTTNQIVPGNISLINGANLSISANLTYNGTNQYIFQYRGSDIILYRGGSY